MKKIFIVSGTIILLFFLSIPSFAQNDTYDEVLLFESFFRDVRISPGLYGNAFYNYDNFDFLDITTMGAQMGLGIDSDLEIAAGVYYITRIPDEVDGESGFGDIPVYARYNFMDDQTKLSGGFFATIPVGAEDIGEGNLDFGPFLALRHPLSEVVALTGTFGVDFRDTAIEDYEASMNFGGGIIYQAASNLFVVGELKVMSDLDYSAISGGLNYQLFEDVHLRTNFLLGLDQNTPDFGLRAGLVVVPR